jgi:fatty acid desaturase
MVAGFGLNLALVASGPEPTVSAVYNITFGLAMYGCYLFLFGSFFVRKYLSGSKVAAARKITQIHGKRYDLVGFVHPGGDAALWHALGRDATVLFESYHPFVSRARLERILAKYAVGEDDIEAEAKEILANGFAFGSAFQRDVVAGTKAYFAAEAKRRGCSLAQATKATPVRWALCLTGFAARLAVLYACCASGHIVWFLVEPVVSWVCAVNTFHDGAHFAFSSKPLVNSIVTSAHPDFTSALDWYIQHNIGHHVSTNKPSEDPDLYHGAAIYRSHESVQWRSLHGWTHVIGTLVWFIAVHAGMIFQSALRMKSSGLYNRCVPLRAEHLTSRDWAQWVLSKAMFLVIYVGVPVYHFGLLRGLGVVGLSRGIFSLLFMVYSQVSHLQTSCMAGSDDWYEHQVLTSANHGCDSRLETFLSGGLNYQIEHHLFPGVNHCHHPALRKIVRHACKDHGIEYKEFANHAAALRGHFQYIAGLAEKPPAHERPKPTRGST